MQMADAVGSAPEELIGLVVLQGKQSFMRVPWRGAVIWQACFIQPLALHIFVGTQKSQEGRHSSISTFLLYH